MGDRETFESFLFDMIEGRPTKTGTASLRACGKESSSKSGNSWTAPSCSNRWKSAR